MMSISLLILTILDLGEKEQSLSVSTVPMHYNIHLGATSIPG